MIGDFNVPTDSEQYKKVHELFGGPQHANDLYGDYIKRTGAKEEATYDGKENSLVVWKGVSARVEFCWNLRQIPGNGFKLRPLVCQKAEVVKQEMGKELSDHWQHVYTVLPSTSK